MDNKWKIWFKSYDCHGEQIGAGVLPYQYAHKSSAVRRAKKHFGNNPRFSWSVSQSNPLNLNSCK